MDSAEQQTPEGPSLQTKEDGREDVVPADDVESRKLNVQHSIWDLVHADRQRQYDAMRKGWSERASEIMRSRDPVTAEYFDDVHRRTGKDFAAIVSEALCASHILWDKYGRTDESGVYRHVMMCFPELESLDHFDFGRLMRAVELSYNTDESVSEEYASILGKILAIDNAKIASASEARTLPLYGENPDRFYLEAAVGPFRYTVLSDIARRDASRRRPTILNDESIFIASKMEQECEMLDIPRTDVSILRADARKITRAVAPGSVGVLRMNNAGFLIVHDDGSFYREASDAVSPEGGKMVVQYWVPSYMEWMEDGTRDELERMLDPGHGDMMSDRCDDPHADIVLGFYDRLHAADPGKWSFEWGHARPDGSFVAHEQPALHPNGGAYLATFVFTRKG